MNWDAIGAIGQVLGSLAVFVSLGYLAVQTKVSASATKHASQNAFVSEYNQFLTDMRTQPELIELLVRASSEGTETLDFKSQEQLHLFFTQQFILSLNMWLQMRAGQFDPRLAKPLIEFFAIQCKSDAAPHTWWSGFKHGWDKEFTSHIDAMIGDPSVPTIQRAQRWWAKIAAQ